MSRLSHSSAVADLNGGLEQLGELLPVVVTAPYLPESGVADQFLAAGDFTQPAELLVRRSGQEHPPVFGLVEPVGGLEPELPLVG